VSPANGRLNKLPVPCTFPVLPAVFPLTSPLLSYNVHVMNKPLDQEIDYRLLKILSGENNLTQREMAKQMGISLGKVNYCLAELAKKGFVKVNRFKGSGNKLQYVYILTPSGLEAKARVTLRFLRRKMKEYEDIKQQIKELTKEIEQDNPDMEDLSAVDMEGVYPVRLAD